MSETNPTYRYSDVEYRLRINYKGFFFYYLIIGLGYLIGLGLFRMTGLWPLALLPGEMAGLALILWKGKIFRREETEPDDSTEKFRLLAAQAITLVGSYFLSHLIFNGDRIVLNFFAGAAAVSVFYIASLFGKTMSLITTPLNGVLVGYLAKYDGCLTRKLMNKIALATVGGFLIMTALCVAASVVILPLLYPSDYEEARRYLILASSSQTIYFIGNILTASVLLRFTKIRNQIVVNVVHGILFAALCIPAAWKFGISGFCWSLLLVNVFRYLLCLFLGYRGIYRSMNDA